MNFIKIIEGLLMSYFKYKNETDVPNETEPNKRVKVWIKWRSKSLIREIGMFMLIESLFVYMVFYNQAVKIRTKRETDPPGILKNRWDHWALPQKPIST